MRFKDKRIRQQPHERTDVRHRVQAIDRPIGRVARGRNRLYQRTVGGEQRIGEATEQQHGNQHAKRRNGNRRRPRADRRPLPAAERGKQRSRHQQNEMHLHAGGTISPFGRRMRIEVAAEQHHLKCAQTHHPHGGSSTEGGQQCPSDHWLNSKQQERANKDRHNRKNLFHGHDYTI